MSVCTSASGLPSAASMTALHLSRKGVTQCLQIPLLPTLICLSSQVHNPYQEYCAQTLLYREQQPLPNSFNIQSASASKSLQQQSHPPYMQACLQCGCLITASVVYTNAAGMIQCSKSQNPLNLSDSALVQGLQAIHQAQYPLSEVYTHSTTSYTTMLWYKRVPPAPVVPALLP
jgi:hypothetical protein